MKQPLIFVVTALRNVGQLESQYFYENGKGRTVKEGPNYVAITLKSAPDSAEDDERTRIKLTVTEKVSRRFRLGGTVELWPQSGPRAQKTKQEIGELKALMAKS